MTGILSWFLSLVLFPPEEREMSERLAPPGFLGNYWGTAANKAREEGKLPPIVLTPHMARWDRWGRHVLRDGDIVFRMGDARLLHGYFPFSRFLANCSNSRFSHTGIIAIEKEGPVVYDMRHPAVARQPFCVWVLDNVGSIGVKRLGPEFRGAIPAGRGLLPKGLPGPGPLRLRAGPGRLGALLRRDDPEGVQGGRDRALQADPLGDMERAPEFPLCMFGLRYASQYNLEHPLDFDTLVYFPGNERHGIWSAKQLMTVVPPTYCPGTPS